MEAQGSQPFGLRTHAHVDYFLGREIERWAEHRGVPTIDFRPTHHVADYGLASSMILACGESGSRTDAMAHRLLEAHWRKDADLSCRLTFTTIATGLGHEADNLLALAASDTVQSKLQANSN